MACSLKTGLCISGLKENLSFSKSKPSTVSGFCSSVCSLQFKESKIQTFPVLNTGFMGKPLVISDQEHKFVKAQTYYCVSRIQKWWEKTLKPNMIEIKTAQAFVDSLLDAGDRLVIVDFFSPNCGGCRALHPKICQLAEMNPDAVFLIVNSEELEIMCRALRVHVFPFFRFYRGGEGRLCSFSCTNATIKKFKDALAKHGTDRCSIVPVKGLDEAELEQLALAGVSVVSKPSSYLKEGTLKDLVMKDMDYSPSCKWTLALAGIKMELMEENFMLKV